MLRSFGFPCGCVLGGESKVSAQPGCFNPGMKGHHGPRSTLSRWMDGWLGVRKGRWSKEVHLLPGMWRVFANYFLCVLTTVVLLSNTSSVWRKKTWDIYSVMSNEPCGSTRSCFFLSILSICGNMAMISFKNTYLLYMQRYLLFSSL